MWIYLSAKFQKHLKIKRLNFFVLGDWNFIRCYGGRRGTGVRVPRVSTLPRYEINNWKPVDTNKYAPLIQRFDKHFLSGVQDFRKQEVTCSLVPSHAYVCEHLYAEITNVKEPHRNRPHVEKLDSCLNAAASQISPDINLDWVRNSASFHTPVHFSRTVEKKLQTKG